MTAPQGQGPDAEPATWRAPEREWWVRNMRGYPGKPGPWHLVKLRAERNFAWSAQAECGVHPDYSHQRCDDRPEVGGLCRKCLAAAEARPGSEVAR